MEGGGWEAAVSSRLMENMRTLKKWVKFDGMLGCKLWGSIVKCHRRICTTIIRPRREGGEEEKVGGAAPFAHGVQARNEA